jgi:hypothetical protein
MKAITVNGTIKKYNKIPKNWRRLATPDRLTVGYDKYLSNEEHELDGFRDLVKPQYDDATQRLGQMIYDEDADNYTFEIVEMTEEEIAEELQRKEDNDQSAKDLARFKADGILYFDRAMAFVMRRKDNGDINENQASRIVKEIYPLIEPLHKGLWLLVKDNIDESDAPNNDDILDIFNTIKSKINEYVTNNF